MKAVGITILSAVCAIAQFATGPAAAATRATTAAGVPYVSGGVGDAEQNRLSFEGGRFNLRVVTAMRRSGQYLADVRVHILDSKGQSVFDERLDGPWLLIDLPAGRYVVEAEFDGKTQRQATSMRRDGHRELMFYFEGPPDQPTAPTNDKKSEVRLQRKRFVLNAPAQEFPGLFLSQIASKIRP